MTHAPLSPSSCDRWSKCVGSPYLIRTHEIKNKTSEAAIRGSELHTQVAEYYLNDATVALDSLAEQAISQLGTLGFEKHDMIIESLYQSQPNFKTYLKHIYGTPDLVIHNPSQVSVIDFKFGKVPVEVKDNAQLMTYLALVVINLRQFNTAYTRYFSPEFKFEIIIIQPTVYDSPKIQAVTLSDVTEHLENLKRTDSLFEKIIELPRDVISDSIYKTGTHCKYCPAKHKCPAQIKNVFKVKDMESAELVSLNDKLDAIKNKSSIIEIIEQFEEEVRTYLKFNKHNNVELKQGAARRSWVDEESAHAFLKTKFSEDKLITKKLISPYKLSNMIGDKDSQLTSFINDNVTTKRCKPSITFTD